MIPFDMDNATAEQLKSEALRMARAGHLGVAQQCVDRIKPLSESIAFERSSQWQKVVSEAKAKKGR